jgi:hypothetical protein
MTPAKRAALKAFREVKAAKAMTEDEITQNAFQDNRDD